MSLYTYDSDLTIDWNDPFRHNKRKLQMSLAATVSQSTAAANSAPVGAPANAGMKKRSVMVPSPSGQLGMLLNLTALK